MIHLIVYLLSLFLSIFWPSQQVAGEGDPNVRGYVVWVSEVMLQQVRAREREGERERGRERERERERERDPQLVCSEWTATLLFRHSPIPPFFHSSDAGGHSGGVLPEMDGGENGRGLLHGMETSSRLCVCCCVHRSGRRLRS